MNEAYFTSSSSNRSNRSNTINSIDSINSASRSIQNGHYSYRLNRFVTTSSRITNINTMGYDDSTERIPLDPIIENDESTTSNHPSYSSVSASQSANNNMKSTKEYSNNSNDHRHDEKPTKKQVDWKILFFGQTLSLALTCIFASASALQNPNTSTTNNDDITDINDENPGALSQMISTIVHYCTEAPLLQIAPAYFLLGSTNLILLLRKEKHSTTRTRTANIDDDEIINLNDGTIDHDYTDDNDVDNDNNNKTPTKQKSIQLHAPWYYYAGLGFLDVQANYFAVLSLRYTTLTSANLLASLNFPSVMIASYFIMGRIFHCQHYVGVFICILGGLTMVLSDYYNDKDGSSSSSSSSSSSDGGGEVASAPLVGDLAAILSALFYGLDDTVAEYFTKHVNRLEYLTMLGLFGFIIAIVEYVLLQGIAALYELPTFFSSSDMLVTNIENRRMEQQQEKEQSQDTDHIILLWAMYILYFNYFYNALSFFLQRAEATLLTLSLQTTQMWATLISIWFQHIIPAPLFYVAVSLTISGVYIYETATSGHGSDTKLEVEDALYGDEETMDDHHGSEDKLLLENGKRGSGVHSSMRYGSLPQ